MSCLKNISLQIWVPKTFMISETRDISSSGSGQTPCLTCNYDIADQVGFSGGGVSSGLNESTHDLKDILLQGWGEQTSSHQGSLMLGSSKIILFSRMEDCLISRLIIVLFLEIV